MTGWKGFFKMVRRFVVVISNYTHPRKWMWSLLLVIAAVYSCKQALLICGGLCVAERGSSKQRQRLWSFRVTGETVVSGLRQDTVVPWIEWPPALNDLIKMFKLSSWHCSTASVWHWDSRSALGSRICLDWGGKCTKNSVTASSPCDLLPFTLPSNPPAPTPNSYSMWGRRCYTEMTTAALTDRGKKSDPLISAIIQRKFACCWLYFTFCFPLSRLLKLWLICKRRQRRASPFEMYRLPMLLLSTWCFLV